MKFPGEKYLAILQEEAFKLEGKVSGDLAPYFGEVGANSIARASKGAIVDSHHSIRPIAGYSPIDTTSFRGKNPRVPDDFYTRQKIYSKVFKQIDNDDDLYRADKMRLKTELLNVKTRDMSDFAASGAGGAGGAVRRGASALLGRGASAVRRGASAVRRGGKDFTA